MSLALQPYYVVPLLIEQPTWGGDYIASFKNLSHQSLQGLKIGQSFELAINTRLLPSVPQTAAFGLAMGGKVTTAEWYGEAKSSLSLTDLAAEQHDAVFGSKVDGHFNTLIKFTQAQNNSYQVHIKPGSTLGHWVAKPESWYFFERGKATLGIKSIEQLAAYQVRCEEIDTYARSLSTQITNGTVTLESARQQLTDFINQHHPSEFVNSVWLEQGQIVDLSQGGIHHSWEKDPQLPAGNIVYEVQVDVLDENCTLRSFDQGNIKEDGSVRPLSIAEYFQALDTDSSHNQIDQYVSLPQSQPIPAGEYVELFTTPQYRSYELRLNSTYHSSSPPGSSFHHVFAKDGQGNIQTSTGNYPLSKGMSVFIPAAIAEFDLIPEQQLTIIVTTV